MNINFNGYYYSIDRLENEVDQSYLMRCWYIVNWNPKNLEEYKQVSKLSKLYVNYKLLNCEYHESVTQMFLKKVPLCF